MNRSDRRWELFPILLVGVAAPGCKDGKGGDPFVDQCLRANLRSYTCYGASVPQALADEVRASCASDGRNLPDDCVDAFEAYYACLNRVECGALDPAGMCVEQNAEIERQCGSPCSGTGETGEGPGCDTQT